MFPAFRPHPLIRGGHAQTILGHYLPGVRLRAKSTAHHVGLADGDQIVLHESRPTCASVGKVVILVHGLGGCHQSGYMLRCAEKLTDRGARVFRMDLRGCGAGLRLAKYPVHAGRSDDIAAVLAYVMETCPSTPVYLVGFSMGANMALKLAGELGVQAPANLAGIMAVSPPIDLIACSRNIDQGWNRFYERSFVRNLVRAAAIRRRHVPAELAPPLTPIPRRLPEFDTLFTARLGGFASAEDYYTRSSSGRVLRDITIPTFILAAADDPIVPVGPFESASYSSSTKLVITGSGGHLGFVGIAGVDSDRRWLDWRVVDWVLSQPTSRQTPETTVRQSSHAPRQANLPIAANHLVHMSPSTGP